jgi:uncharacterized protein YyaL (SSP411 family)
MLLPAFSAIRCTLLAGALLAGCSGGACSGGVAPAAPAATSASAAPAEDPALRARLLAALAAKGPDYVPRTRHKNPDGSPRYTNRLILEASPYLLQHAHNPVNWYPWGEEAFARAKATGKPVFLSVGYSTCHWCHVMEEESFEDEQIAAYLNEHYVAIKVDREERADVDAVYMTALQSFTGSGGWPMSVWLTPAREPFFAGTYFPPQAGVRGARRGFLSVLTQLAESYAAEPATVARDARTFAERLKKLAALEPAGDLPSAAAITRAVESAVRRFDAVNGGASGAPKFPSSFPVRLLLRHARRAAAPASASMAIETLDKMRAGGIHDQVGGGFHRYATDARWLVPHFEKMLYDNAQLALAYLEAGQASGEERFFATARETLDYLLREMRAPDGTFYAATDADSLAPSGRREEGWFFTWTPAEVEAALDADAERAALAYFAVTPAGNLDGRTVLSTPRPAADVAKDLGFDPARFAAAISAAREGLAAARAKRPAPLRDDKSIVAWNALVISALARAAITLGDERYGDAAVRGATALVRTVRADQPLPHALVRGAPSGRGFLDDHAALALALLDVLELTSDVAWLRDAQKLMERVEKSFADRVNGGYFLTADDAETLLLRDKPNDDGPMPSGNSLAALAWQRLAVLTADDRYRARAETTLRAFAAPLARSPAALDAMLVALDFATDSPKEIAIVLPDDAGADPPKAGGVLPGTAGRGGEAPQSGAGALRPLSRPLLDVLRRTFVPNAVLAVGTASDLAGPLGEALPWVKEKPAKDGKPTAYVCERGACKLPVTDPAAFAKTLAEVKPY